MNNNDFTDGRERELRYDPAESDDRGLSLQPERHEKPPREGTTHAAKLASLSILFSLVIVIGSLAYIVNTRQATTGTRASVDNLYGPASISAEDKELTASMAGYPTKYRDRPIPANLVNEGTQKYFALPEAERKAYIINRIALYYIYNDVLTINNISYTKAASPLTFEGIEQALPSISATMKKEYPQSEVFVNEYLSRFSYE